VPYKGGELFAKKQRAVARPTDKPDAFDPSLQRADSGCGPLRATPILGPQRRPIMCFIMRIYVRHMDETANIVRQ